MPCRAVERHAADCGTKDTECRKGDIVAKQSDCIASSRKTNTQEGVLHPHQRECCLGGRRSARPSAAFWQGNMRIVNGENHILGLAASRSYRHTPAPDMPAARFNEGAS